MLMEDYRNDLRKRVRVLGDHLLRLNTAEEEWDRIAALRARRLASLMDVSPSARLILGRPDPTGVICCFE